MKKRLLSILLILTMMCGLLSAMSFSASAEEPEEHSEVLTFNGHTFAQTDHFTLRTRMIGSVDGWYASDIDSNELGESKIVIEAKSDGIIITGIDAVIGNLGCNYHAAAYTSAKRRFCRHG